MRAAVALLVCVVVIVSAQDLPTGLHLTGSNSKIAFGPNNDCTIQLKHDGGSAYLESSCPISEPAAPAAPAGPPPCDQIALTGTMDADKECGMYNCAIGETWDACIPCESFVPPEDPLECSSMQHCTVNDINNPTGCASCESIQNPTDVADCSSARCGWDGASSTCTACTALQAADEAACKAYGCEKSTAHNDASGLFYLDAAEGYCISLAFSP